MKSLLLRFYHWLGRLLGIGQDTKYEIRVTREEVDKGRATSDDFGNAVSPVAPQVTLPTPPPPQFDIHTGETAQFGRKSSILTKPEQRAYKSLLLAVGSDYQVMSKVRLWDFIWLVNEPPERKQHLSRLSCRHVDFLLCAPLTLAPRLVIELDDHSHKRPEAIAADQYKDELFAAAGLPLLRLDHPNYPPRRLRERIERALDRELP